MHTKVAAICRSKHTDIPFHWIKKDENGIFNGIVFYSHMNILQKVCK
jgi:hypothetical protein